MEQGCETALVFDVRTSAPVCVDVPITIQRVVIDDLLEPSAKI